MKMVPNVLGDEVKSKAERKVFEMLKKSTFEGYAFHSVGLPEHARKSYSEADFIIVTVNGILCLEVKGGRVECNNGIWCFINQYGQTNTKREGPYEQAAGALFALKTELCKLLPSLNVKDMSFATGVVFPDITFEYRGVSIIPEITFDLSFTGNIDDYISQCHAYWDNRNRKKYFALCPDEINSLKGAIRDDLCFVPSLNAIADSIDADLIRLTEEQCGVLESLTENTKVIVNGPAGSGKTILAMHFARLCAAQNKRVLFLTFNKVLAQYLNRRYTNDLIAIKHLHGLISDYVPIDDVNKYSVNYYYSRILPDRFVKYLDSHKIALYDVLIVDEGQDLLKPQYVYCLDKLIKGGLYRGEWSIFYDANQSIFNLKLDKCIEEINKYYPTKVKLSKNCRNTMPIARFTSIISGIDSGKALVEGENVDILTYDDENSYETTLFKVIKHIQEEGIRSSDIVLLSPVSYERSKLADTRISDLITQDILGEDDKIRFATIQSYKGLDSKVIIALNTEDIIANNYCNILYTLLSRARVLLYVYVDKATATLLQNKIIDTI